MAHLISSHRGAGAQGACLSHEKYTVIHQLSGDVLLIRTQLICHGVAPNDPHQQGLAPALRARWLAMYKDFKHLCRLSHPAPGGTWHWGAAGGLRITSLLTQDATYDRGSKPGKAHTDHVSHALKELARWLVEEKIETAALPRLTTGVGALDGADVEPIVRHQMAEIPTVVHIYLYALREGCGGRRDPGQARRAPMSYEQLRDTRETHRRTLSVRMGNIESHLRSPGDPDWKEQATERVSDEVLEALDACGRRGLEALDTAIARLDAGTHGELLGCGDRIPEGRLKALPTPPFCIECAT